MAAKLKKGEVLNPFGPDSSITNKELTDSNAVFCLEKDPSCADKFEKLPEGWTPKANETNDKNPENK